MTLSRILYSAMAASLIFVPAAQAQTYKETPSLAADVNAGKLPPIDKRLPKTPHVSADSRTQTAGRGGGELRMLIGRARDVRMLTVYGYARLVGYDENFQLKPDIAEAVDVREGRIFTIRLREGHRWSDGKPFTSEDFRYFWQDVANNRELSPTGIPISLLLDGEAPKVEFPDARTIRYSWSKPNPFFLHRLAGASPLYIYRPAHYLRRTHAKYAKPSDLKAAVTAANMRGWAELHNKLDNMYQFDNPDLPTLEPWMNTTRGASIRFVAERNPYFHRVDSQGQQLPYIDRVILNQADAKLIPAKVGAGEADLQARNLAFNNFTFLKEGENRGGYKTHLWKTAKGSQVAIYPNLNANDPIWRTLNRDVRFRRALSLAIDREAINQALFFGLARPANNTVLPESPLYRESYATQWTQFDLRQANALLDELGLRRGPGGVRQLPNGRPVEIIVETAGEDSEQTDMLELIRESWAKAGIKLFPKPSQRESLRNRIYSGDAVMTVWGGLENGIPRPEMSPGELAPTQQDSAHWPKWGQYFETKGKAGEQPDMAEAQRLFRLYQDWSFAKTDAERAALWAQMLAIHADQQFTIGTVHAVQQPVVAKNNLRNLPAEGIYNFDPGAFFGVYRLDRIFWAR